MERASRGWFHLNVFWICFGAHHALGIKIGERSLLDQGVIPYLSEKADSLAIQLNGRSTFVPNWNKNPIQK